MGGRRATVGWTEMGWRADEERGFNGWMRGWAGVWVWVGGRVGWRVGVGGWMGGRMVGGQIVGGSLNEPWTLIIPTEP